MTLTESLLERIVRFCSEEGMTERQFGLTVANNHKLITRLRAGFGVNSQTHDRIVAFIGDSRGVRPPASAILAPRERELLMTFRSIDRQGREMILRLAKSLHSDNQREAAE